MPKIFVEPCLLLYAKLNYRWRCNDCDILNSMEESMIKVFVIPTVFNIRCFKYIRYGYVKFYFQKHILEGSNLNLGSISSSAQIRVSLSPLSSKTRRTYHPMYLSPLTLTEFKKCHGGLLKIDSIVLVAEFDIMKADKRGRGHETKTWKFVCNPCDSKLGFRWDRPLLYFLFWDTFLAFWHPSDQTSTILLQPFFFRPWRSTSLSEESFNFAEIVIGRGGKISPLILHMLPF